MAEKKSALLLFIMFLIAFTLIPVIEALGAEKSDTGKIVCVLLDKQSQKPAEGLWIHLLQYEGKDSEGKDITSLFILDGEFPRGKSDSSGRFSFKNVPPGRYVIKSGTATEFAPTDAGATSLKDSAGNVIIINFTAGQTMDLGKVYIKR